jgi:hypothetical protein
MAARGAFLLIRPKSVQKKQAFEMLLEQGEKKGRVIGLMFHGAAPFEKPPPWTVKHPEKRLFMIR